MKNDFMPLTRLNKPKYVKQVFSGDFFVTVGAIIVNLDRAVYLDLEAPIFSQKDDIACVGVSKNGRKIIIDIKDTEYRWTVSTEIKDSLLLVSEVIY